MKKFLTTFFVTLGVLFFALILCGVYLFVVDPYNLKPLFLNSDSEPQAEVAKEHVATSTAQATVVDSHPTLSESQEAALENVGINPAALPSEITPAQEQCFIDAIGSERVGEIVAGGSPTPVEIFKARGCL